MKLKIFLLSIYICLMTGCATAESTFSCNSTATDSCMSIDQVNMMTEQRNSKSTPSKSHKSKRVNERNLSLNGQRIWLSPWVDDEGIKHDGETLHLAKSKSEG